MYTFKDELRKLSLEKSVLSAHIKITAIESILSKKGIATSEEINDEYDFFIDLPGFRSKLESIENEINEIKEMEKKNG